MVILLPVLMGYSLVGELYHEIVGIAAAVLFTAHIVLNRKWFTSLFRGRYDPRRIAALAVNCLLILCALTSMVSGVFLSKFVFGFLGISALSTLMRTLHMLATYWVFLLMGFHAGSHGGRMMSGLGNKTVRYAVSGAFLLISAYGIYAFIRRGLADYLFGRIVFVFFDYSEPFIFFYLDYLAVTALMMTLGYIVFKLLTIKKRKRNR